MLEQAIASRDYPMDPIPRKTNGLITSERDSVIYFSRVTERLNMAMFQLRKQCRNDDRKSSKWKAVFGAEPSLPIFRQSSDNQYSNQVRCAPLACIWQCLLCWPQRCSLRLLKPCVSLDSEDDLLSTSTARHIQENGSFF